MVVVLWQESEDSSRLMTVTVGSVSVILQRTTIKPVYNDRSRYQVMVVFVDRWSLYRGTLVSLKSAVEQPTVVSIDRWSFYTSGLQDRFTVLLRDNHQ